MCFNENGSQEFSLSLLRKKHLKMEISIPQKVLKYEAFINDVLKEQLKKTAEDLDRTYGEIAEFIQLENLIQTIEENGLSKDGLKTQVDIGCNFYMQACVPDTSKILIDIGLGYFVEYTLNEALIVIKRRINLLNRKVDILRDQSANTKAHIKLVLHGIQELQNIK
ncbi:hypothetical protein J6590_020862 [Homalodisca vitripennis]|nr:hypothetical protein J6590_020862 [Homalodisca vitripennis]